MFPANVVVVLNEVLVLPGIVVPGSVVPILVETVVLLVGPWPVTIGAALPTARAETSNGPTMCAARGEEPGDGLAEPDLHELVAAVVRVRVAVDVVDAEARVSDRRSVVDVVAVVVRAPRAACSGSSTDTGR